MMNFSSLSDSDKASLRALVGALFIGGIQVYPTGSREIGGFTSSSDYDFVVEDDPFTRELINSYTGWNRLGEDYSDSPSRSYRKGALNVILVDSENLILWRKATAIAKVLRPVDKSSRIAIFNSVLNGETLEAENPV